MKKSVLFSAVCIALLSLNLVSCKKKEVFSLVGTWDLTRVMADKYTNGVLTNTKSKSASELGYDITYTFEATGRVVVTENGQVVACTYNFTSDALVLAFTLNDVKMTESQMITIPDNDTFILTVEDINYTDENGNQILEIVKYEYSRRK